MNFLITVAYGSPRPHWHSCKTFKKIVKNWNTFSMIASKKTQQNTSGCNPFLFEKGFKLNKKLTFLVKHWEIQVIVSIFMLTRFSQMIFNPMRNTGIFVSMQRMFVTTCPDFFIWHRKVIMGMRGEAGFRFLSSWGSVVVVTVYRLIVNQTEFCLVFNLNLPPTKEIGGP